ncbi:hypothetical protein A6X21_15560 [Planctopirus hydrillae]|uniref:Uncharacterized protein n=2 Tax=Planctopirus hydrillae TaxID=1841610 RepID=A0A1C3EUC3_9PLAN|nr:hypothetical protein A6X21_15560 [Planctopirus hydrillae]
MSIGSPSQLLAGAVPMSASSYGSLMISSDQARLPRPETLSVSRASKVWFLQPNCLLLLMLCGCLWLAPKAGFASVDPVPGAPPREDAPGIPQGVAPAEKDGLSIANGNAPQAGQALAGQPVVGQPLGQFVRVTAPINDVVFNQITGTAQKLQATATAENRPAVMVLEIEPGVSPPHQVQGLVRFLLSAQTPRVRFVAWVPQTVTGRQAMVALACQDVVMKPDAELGDLGRGEKLPEEDQQLLQMIASRRVNPRVSSAVLSSLTNREAVLWKVTVEKTGAGGEKGTDIRFVDAEELKQLQASQAVILETQRLKEAGLVGRFSGETLRSWGMVCTQTAETKTEVADLYQLPKEAMRMRPAEEQQKVGIIRLDGVINQMNGSFLRRQIARYQAQGVELLIIEIDSPGGLATVSSELAELIASLSEEKIRTVAWIPRQAISGAAMVALGCDEIYMAPNAKMGDVQPIEARPGEAFERVPDKVMTVIRATLLALAKQKGRPEAIAAAMADRGTRVFRMREKSSGRVWFMTEEEAEAAGDLWERGPQLEETRGEMVITLTAPRAVELKMADGIVPNLDALKEKLGISAEMRLQPIKPSWVDSLVFVLNTTPMKVLLLMVALGALYLEAHFFTGILSIVSATSFTLFFWAAFLGGTAGWLEVSLFLLGVVLIAMEIFVIPGFGVTGISGILLVLTSLVMAIESFRHVDAWGASINIAHGLGTISAAMVGVMIFGFFVSKYLPNLPWMEAMILAPPGGAAAIEATGRPRLRHDELQAISADLMGAHGVATTVLRPSGKARVGQQILDVVSDGGFVQPGTPIEVISVDGVRIVVRPSESHPA